MFELFVVLAGLVVAAVVISLAVAVIVAVVVAIALVVELVCGLVLLPLGLFADPFSGLLLVGGVVLAALVAVALSVLLPFVGAAVLALAPVALVGAVLVLVLRARTVPAPPARPALPAAGEG